MKLYAASFAVCGAILFAQATRDFLTADEIDQIRLTAQDPIARLTLYSTFARLRVDLVKSAIEQKKPGRSGLIHDTLEDYTKIIEAIDTVTDDALKRNAKLDEAIPVVIKAEEETLADLQKIQESEPSDVNRYKFALVTAIETTQDSLELFKVDLADRRKSVVTRDAEEKKQRETMMTPDAAKARAEEAKKKTDSETKQKRKAPTLRRKGERPPDQQQ